MWNGTPSRLHLARHVPRDRAGAVIVPLDVSALTDAVSDNNETVHVSIRNGAGYIPGALSSALMKIIDNMIQPPLPVHRFDLE